MADLNLKLKIQGDSKQAEDSANRVSHALRGIEESGAKLNGMLAGLGFGVSIAGIGAFIKSGIDAADALNDLSDRTGIAIETLAGLDYAVKIGDTSIEAFATSIQRLSVNMGKYKDDFAQLGITAKDPIEAFKQLADVFSSIEDPQQRAAVGAAALGKSYAEMAPLLLQGADGIQALIDKGKEHNPVTAEQARLAGEFNDKLDELNNRMQHFSVIVAGPVIEALNGFAQGIQFASAAVDGFDPLGWLNAGGYGASGKAGQLQYLNEQIDETTKAMERLANRSVSGQIADAIFGGDNNEDLYEKLQKLTKMRDALTAPVSAPSAKVAPDQSAINNLLKISDDAEKSIKRVATSAKSSADTRAKSVNDVIAALQRDIELSGLSAEQQRQATELSNALKNARGEEVDIITSLVAKKYELIEADKRQSNQWQQLIEDANAYYDLRKNISSLADSNLSLDGFNGGIGQIQDQLAAGVINPEQAKTLFDQLGRSYNESFIYPALSGTDQLSEYAVQAARNMQSAFADFLFDPFDQGMTGMLDGFLTTIRRMAAEAASAQIMEALFGKTSKSGGFDITGSLLGAAFSGIGGLFGGGLNSDINSLVTTSGLYHDGGVVGAGGISVSVPSSAFLGAPRLHNGGYLKPDEVPAILQTGEMVLSRNQVANIGSGSGDVQISTVVNVNGNSNADNAQRLGEMVNARVREIIVTEKRPGGLLA